MHLTPKDEDRLLVFLAAELARKHRAAGLALTYAEARALIADEVIEAARSGAGVAEAAAIGADLLTDDDVMPGVRTLLGSVQVEAFFDDGQKLVTVHDAIGPGTRTADEIAFTPGEVLPADGDLELNADRATVSVSVQNTGDRPIQVGSHSTSSNATGRCGSTGDRHSACGWTSRRGWPCASNPVRRRRYR